MNRLGVMVNKKVLTEALDYLEIMCNAADSHVEMADIVEEVQEWLAWVDSDNALAAGFR